MGDLNKYAAVLPELAHHYWGEPNASMSKPGIELRFGSKGSKSVNLVNGVWYDHENKVGGGAKDLVAYMEPTANIAERLEKFGLPREAQLHAKQIVAPNVSPQHYDYADENGIVRYRAVRTEKADGVKSFSLQVPDPQKPGKFKSGTGFMKGIQRLPYRLPDIIGRPSEPIIVVEGEKCADATANLGFVATTNSEGASKWKPELNPHFRGRNVIIIPDNDKAGRDHRDQIIVELSAFAKSIRIVELPGLQEKGDIYDWLKMGGTKEALLELIANAKNSLLRKTFSINPAEYTAEEWEKKSLPPKEFLLGQVMTTTSRWMLYGETGVGKTLLSLDMAAAIATGASFLNWPGSGKSRRVLYIDGELPSETVKARVKEMRKRYSVSKELVILSRDALPDGSLPPLNKDTGRNWLMDFIEEHSFDVIFFDSIMCLLEGDMKDETVWEPMKPLIRSLSTRKIAQVWLHHTGHDTTKGYGTKTREWELDTVLSLTFHNKEAGQIKLEFSKNRNKNPENENQYKPLTLQLGAEGWIHEGQQRNKTLTSKSDHQMLIEEFLESFDRLVDDYSELSPGHDFMPVKKLSLERVRDDLSSRGFLERDGPKNGLSVNERSKFSRAKKALFRAKTLTEKDGLIWRIRLKKSEPDTFQ